MYVLAMTYLILGELSVVALLSNTDAEHVVRLAESCRRKSLGPIVIFAAFMTVLPFWLPIIARSVNRVNKKRR